MFSFHCKAFLIPVVEFMQILKKIIKYFEKKLISYRPSSISLQGKQETDSIQIWKIFVIFESLKYRRHSLLTNPGGRLVNWNLYTPVGHRHLGKSH